MTVKIWGFGISKGSGIKPFSHLKFFWIVVFYECFVNLVRLLDFEYRFGRFVFGKFG